MRITSNKPTGSSIVAKFEVTITGTVSHSPGLFELIKSVTYTDNKSFPRFNRLTVGIKSIYEKTLCQTSGYYGKPDFDFYNPCSSTVEFLGAK